MSMSLIEQLKKRKTLILKEPLVVRLGLTKKGYSSSSPPPVRVEIVERIPWEKVKIIRWD